jgi:hypothetical protein
LQLLLSGEPDDDVSEEDRLSEEGEPSSSQSAAARRPLPGQACGYPLADEAEELPAHVPASHTRRAAAAPLGSSASAALLRASSSSSSEEATASRPPAADLDAGPRPPGAASPGRRSLMSGTTSPSKARSLRLSQVRSESPKPEGASREQEYFSPVALRSLAMAEVAHSEGADILTL